MYHWSTRPRWTVFSGNISRMTAFMIGLSAILVLGFGKNFTRSAFCTLARLEKECRTLTVYHLDFDRLCTTFKKAHSPPSKFLLQLCLLKWSFCCLFFFRGSVISLLPLTNHSLTKAAALNLSSSCTFCTELTTAESMTSFMSIETN